MGDRKTTMGGVSVPMAAFNALPEVQWDHIDGPLMTWAGCMHWLTGWERFLLILGWTTEQKIAKTRFGRPITNESED